ncbi:hypothetical protein J2T02_001321 [Chitinophaga terrae (ex Kim and Jung 2007)]|uniref:hypothetical protein n=1 Tax=Chitinophaga terrae (ex Kim and Jung 2007) TaxID=408074 RepID=UPI00277F532C|nr:hypothetical protein [Chitinophaga terrae (ex Kim and Jung 2007)]MDQ0106213.1 hypothetical protein [Chitinophaga terrae (ex Kim and Jung 2007)]
MEELKSIYQALLYSDGIGQWDRLLSALRDDYVQLEDRDPDELLQFLYGLSKQLVFFNKEGYDAGNWTGLFKSLLANTVTPQLEPIEVVAESRRETQDLPPQVTLLLTFLSLYNKLKDHLNALPSAHAKWYYSKLLKFPLHEPVPDKVQVLFELNKNAAPQLIRANTLLNAGKTEDGISLGYLTMSDIVVNHAQAVTACSLFPERFPSGTKYWKKVYDLTSLQGNFLPFGIPQGSTENPAQVMEPATVGWAVASQLLEMKGGRRQVTITLTSVSYPVAPALADISGITLALTGEKGWITPQILAAEMIAAPFNSIQLRWTLLLLEGSGAVTGFSNAIHTGNFPEGIPVLKVLGSEKNGIPDELLNFQLDAATVSVTVKGLKQLVVQNDEGLLNPNSPFAIFGSWPAIGSRFYIGCRECFSKNITQATVHLKWQNPPADFAAYYAGYSIVPWFSYTDFKVNIDMLLNGTFDEHELVEDGLMFQGGSKDLEASIELTENKIQTANGAVPLARDVEIPDLSGGYVPGIDRGFIRLTLSGPTYPSFTAFGHNNYANALAAATQAMIQNPAGTHTIPQAPYTPVLKEVSLDYTATDTVFPGDSDRFFHITPFGIEEQKEAGISLFPSFPDYGYLYIGFDNLLPLQQVNTLFHFAPDEVPPSGTDPSGYADPVISWSYLAGNTWQRLRTDQVALDTTAAFRQTGIIALQTGDDANNNAAAMPGRLTWLRAALQQGLNRIAPIDGIFTQAVEAVLDVASLEQFPDTLAAHLTAGLPPAGIAQLPAGSNALKRVMQPYASYGGRPAESAGSFMTRMSERLRHRNRAIQSWDIERIGLAAFPEIAKIKSLNASTTVSPGITTVVIIPKVNMHQPLAKRLQPKANGYTLDNIASGLRSYLPAFAGIQVLNPVYEELLADFKVKFLAGYDPAYYLEQLNTDLIRYISPWAFDEASRLHFDTAVYRSEIIYFIENLPYVDYITDFRLFHLEATDNGSSAIGKMKIGKDFSISRKPNPFIDVMTIGDDFLVGTDWEVVTPSLPASILVSVPRHAITVVDSSRSCNSVIALGIGMMTVNIDFIISKS